ncbi:MAG: PAC2 family protein [Candidatus Diapherotrites archaeon]
MEEHANVEIIEFKPEKLNGYTLVEGFPGLGLVGTICSKHLIEKLGMNKYGFIKSNIFTPIIRIREGKPVFPSRMFISKKHKLIVMISEQIIQKEFTDDFARTIAEWARKKKFSRVISLNGLTSTEEMKNIYGYGASDNAVKFLKKKKIEIIKEGITSGISAIMLLELKNCEIMAMAMLAPVKISADYAASVKLLEKINEIFSLKMDLKSLKEEAKKVETELSGYIEKIKAAQTQQKSLQEATETDTPSYT